MGLFFIGAPCIRRKKSGDHLLTEARPLRISYADQSGMHPSHEGLVKSYRPPSSKTGWNQYHVAGMLVHRAILLQWLDSVTPL